MWTRAELKQLSKHKFQKNKSNSRMISLLYLFLTGGLIDISISVPETQTTYDGFTYYAVNNGYPVGLKLGSISFNNIMYITAGTASLLFLVFLIYNILVIDPLEVGEDRYYLLNSVEDEIPEYNILTFPFKIPQYLHIACVQLIKELKVLLWTFLLIIPGIVKRLEYCMIPFLLADYPDISSSKAHELSKKMTNGYKGDILILYLSFILWFIFSAITFKISEIVFSRSYYKGTFCELYKKLKEEQNIDYLMGRVEKIEEIYELNDFETNENGFE